MLRPNNSVIPSTSTKLNFYLAQINRNGNKNSGFISQKRHLKSNQPYIYSPDLGPQSSQQSDIKISPYINIPTNRQVQHSSFGLNKQNYNPSQDRSKLNHQKYSQKRFMNDSLDVLVTDRENIDTVVLSPIHHKEKSECREYKLNRNCQSDIFTNNYSDISHNNSFGNDSSSISLKSNKIFSSDLQYFDHTNQVDSKPKKKVNWNIKSLQKQRTSVKMRQSFQQISKQLSKLTQQLNKNSKKLQQMNKLYTHMKKSNPQQSIKRANLKYATVDVSQTKKGIEIKHHPRIQYEDKVYRDPRYLIWQPLHSHDHYSLHS